MLVVDSPFHVTLTSLSELPAIACVSRCKKVWWQADFDIRQHGICPQCSGPLSEAVKGVHYSVIYHSNRPLRRSDLKRFAPGFKESAISSDGRAIDYSKMFHLSYVKPKFVEMAKREWC